MADSRPETLPLIGGAPCLDFCNTISWRTSPAPVERLGDYGGLLTWGVRAGLLPAGDAEALGEEACRGPHEARAAFARAVALRERLVATFDALAAGRTPDAGDLDACRLAYAGALSAARLCTGPDAPVLEWPDGAGLERPLWPVACSAWSLLMTSPRPRVRVCGGTGCGWLFVDDSRNASRRWCSANDCGRRERVRRHRARRASAPR